MAAPSALSAQPLNCLPTGASRYGWVSVRTNVLYTPMVPVPPFALKVMADPRPFASIVASSPSQAVVSHVDASHRLRENNLSHRRPIRKSTHVAISDTKTNQLISSRERITISTVSNTNAVSVGTK